MRVVIVLALCSWSITAAAQAPVAVESAEQDPRTTCTAEGTLTAITIACHDAGVVPVRDRLACATLLTAELLPEAGLETLVECGDPHDGSSRIAFAIFSGAQLHWVLEPGFEYGARFEIVDLIDRGAEHGPQFEVVVRLGSEDGSDVLIFAARPTGVARVFRAYLGGGGDPVRSLSFVLAAGDARIELRSGRGRPEIWRFDPAAFAYVQ